MPRCAVLCCAVLFRTLLDAVNALSSASPALDATETQFVQSFYDTTYRAHMMRCLMLALKLCAGVGAAGSGVLEGVCGGGRGGGGVDDVLATNRSVIAGGEDVEWGGGLGLCWLGICVYFFDRLSLHSLSPCHSSLSVPVLQHGLEVCGQLRAHILGTCVDFFQVHEAG